MATMDEYLKTSIEKAIENAKSDKEKVTVLKNLCNGFVRDTKGQVLDGIKDEEQALAIGKLLQTMDQTLISETVKTLPKHAQDIIKSILNKDIEKESIQPDVEEESEKEEVKKSKGFKLAFGEYGKYLRYIDRGEAEPATVGSILKSHFSAKKEQSLLEMLVVKMGSQEKIAEAFNLIPEDKQMAIAKNIFVTNKEVWEKLKVSIPELAQAVEMPKEEKSKEEKTVARDAEEITLDASTDHALHYLNVEDEKGKGIIADNKEEIANLRKQTRRLKKELHAKNKEAIKAERIEKRAERLAEKQAKKEERAREATKSKIASLKEKLSKSILSKIEKINAQEEEKSNYERMIESLREKLAELDKGKEGQAYEH